MRKTRKNTGKNKKSARGGARPRAGRPCRYAEGRVAKVSVTIPQTMVDRVDAVARQMQRSRSEVVTQAVRRMLELVDIDV